MSVLDQDVRDFSQNAIVTMFEIDLQYLQLGVFRFSPTSVGGAAVMFGGNEYMAAPIEASGFAWDGKGQLPQPTLKLASSDLSFLNLVVDADDLVGATVTRIKTYRKYLDDGDMPNTGITFPTEVYVINQKNSQSRTLLQFTLAAKMVQESTKLPRLLILRDTCVHHYRRYDGTQFVYDNVTCPYAGSNMYKFDGSSTTNPAEDVCGKRITDCKARFGTGDDVVLPRLAFPGTGRQ